MHWCISPLLQGTPRNSSLLEWGVTTSRPAPHADPSSSVVLNVVALTPASSPGGGHSTSAKAARDPNQGLT
eukprot:scaffold92450_cov69-Phaeocystis_antarctica.AAC.1